MMDSRIDKRAIRQLRKSCYFIYKGGSESTFWFLALKNYVAASQAKPEKVFIFFRDYRLTDPRYEIDGEERYRKNIEQASTPDEPELDAFINRSQHVTDRLFRILTGLYPSLEHNQRLNLKLTDAVATLLTHGEADREAFQQRVNARFRFDQLRDLHEGPLWTVQYLAPIVGAVLPKNPSRSN